MLLNIKRAYIYSFKNIAIQKQIDFAKYKSSKSIICNCKNIRITKLKIVYNFIAKKKKIIQKIVLS